MRKAKQFGILVAIAALVVGMVMLNLAAPHAFTSPSECGDACKCGRRAAFVGPLSTSGPNLTTAIFEHAGTSKP